MYNPTEFRKNKEQLRFLKAITILMAVSIAAISILCVISVGEAQRLTRKSADLQESLVRADGEIAYLNVLIDNLKEEVCDER